MKRRTFLALLTGTPVLGSLDYLVSSETSAQESGDQATVAALQTQVASLQTQVAGGATKPPAARGAQGGVIYQTLGSKAFDTWPTAPSWKHLRGMLVSDGTGMGVLYSPREPGSVADYAVEAEIQIVQTGQSCASARFGLVARDVPNVGGYEGVYRPITTCTSGGSGSIDAYLPSSYRTELVKQGIDVDADWHTYRFEVNGNQLRFLIDDAEVVSITDNRYLDPGRAGVFSDQAQINMRSFRLLRL